MIVYILLVLALNDKNELSSNVVAFEDANTCLKAQEDFQKDLAPKFSQLKVSCLPRKVIK